MLQEQQSAINLMTADVLDAHSWDTDSSVIVYLKWESIPWWLSIHTTEILFLENRRPTGMTGGFLLGTPEVLNNPGLLSDNWVVKQNIP